MFPEPRHVVDMNMVSDRTVNNFWLKSFKVTFGFFVSISCIQCSTYSLAYISKFSPVPTFKCFYAPAVAEGALI